MQHDLYEFGDEAVEAQETTDPYELIKERCKWNPLHDVQVCNTHGLPIVTLCVDCLKGEREFLCCAKCLRSNDHPSNHEMEFGLTDEEMTRFNFFVKCYGTYENLAASVEYFGASVLDSLDYVPAPIDMDSPGDTNEPYFDDQLVAKEYLNVIDNYTELLESTADDVRSQASDGELTPGITEMRSLIVCYFPREANKDMIRRAFLPYGPIDSVYLVHKEGKPACFGFVNFNDHPSAASALAAAKANKIELVDKRDVTWNLKAEWTSSSEIPRKPKKKRRKKHESSPTPPVDLNSALMMYHPKAIIRGLPKHAKEITQNLSYTVPTAAYEQGSLFDADNLAAHAQQWSDSKLALGLSDGPQEMEDSANFSIQVGEPVRHCGVWDDFVW
jgi:hypothetical protein